MFKYVKVTVFLSTMFTSFGVMSLKQGKNVYSNMSLGVQLKSNNALPVRNAMLLSLLSLATLC